MNTINNNIIYIT